MDGQKNTNGIEQTKISIEKIIIFLMAIIPITVLLILFEIKMAGLK